MSLVVREAGLRKPCKFKGRNRSEETDCFELGRHGRCSSFNHECGGARRLAFETSYSHRAIRAGWEHRPDCTNHCTKARREAWTVGYRRKPPRRVGNEGVRTVWYRWLSDH